MLEGALRPTSSAATHLARSLPFFHLHHQEYHHQLISLPHLQQLSIYPTEAVVARYKQEWVRVMDRIKKRCENLSELAVIYLSCRRSSPLESSWVSSHATNLIKIYHFTCCCRDIEH